MFAKCLSDWRSHAVALLLIVVAELIGVIPVKLGLVSFGLLPMLYVLIFGIALGAAGVIPKKVMDQASPCIALATLWLVARLSAAIGPNLGAIAKAGPALILQEFGNLGTIFLSVPVAVFVFKMGRQAVGAGFSNSREPSIALVGSIYGLNGPEGQGVMGAYVTGTVLGTIFFSIASSLAAASGLFHPFSLAMAAGTGSASMMAASMGPVVEAFPEMAEEITALAASSNLLSTVDSLYLSLFLAIPLTNWLYKALKGPERYKAAEAKREAGRAEKLRAKGIAAAEIAPVDEPVAAAAPVTFGEKWMTRGKVLVISGVMMVVANWINSWRSGAATVVDPAEGMPGIVMMGVAVFGGLLVFDLITGLFPKITMPALLYASIIGIVLCIPGVPGSEYAVAGINKYGVLPMCTPVLAYAGVAIGRDLDGFKRQGVGIVCTAITAFIGTYVGSAIIAEIVLKFTGVI